MHLRDLFPDINPEVFAGFGDNPFSESTINKQMTKEDCLNKYDTSRNYIEQTCRPELFAAMDEYAKHFGRWIAKEKFESVDGNTMRSSKWNCGLPYTIDDLHQLFENQFIEQQNKP